MTTPKSFKHLEIETYTHVGISVRVRIDYDKGKISLLESNDGPKRWVFADRELEYMQGWQNILDAMKFAIEEATKKLQKHQTEREKALKRKEINLMLEIAKAEKKHA